MYLKAKLGQKLEPSFNEKIAFKVSDNRITVIVSLQCFN